MFNVLIGEQATGKSTVAKLLAVCRYFSYIALDDVIRGESKFFEGLTAWGLDEAVKKDSYIFYSCKHYSLTVEQTAIPVRTSIPDDNEKHEDLMFIPSLKPISKEFIDLLSELRKIWSAPRVGPVDPVNRIIPTSFFQNEVANVMDNPFYLPAERGLQSIFSLGKSSIENISDSLFNQFAQLDQIARLFKNDTIIEPLEITYKNVDGKGYIKKNSEKQFYSLFNAASGYQSTIPVVLMTKYYTGIRKKKKTFIIEEPEMNLFPSAQQKLMRYLVDRTTNYENSILATTQSPYVLTSLNNMMYAYQIGKKHSSETDSIIEKKYWLDPNDVSAYILLPNGTCEDIFDGEEGLIKAEKIDSVSGILNEQFNALLNIEFEKK
jgi:AAA ATPase-like protein